MEAVIFVLILFCIVILIVSIVYITSTLRHKERMALLDKGKDPNFFGDDAHLKGAIKWGLILLCAGGGIFTAFLLNYFVFPGNDGEAVFPGLLFIGAGTGLMIFYKKFK